MGKRERREEEEGREREQSDTLAGRAIRPPRSADRLLKHHRPWSSVSGLWCAVASTPSTKSAVCPSANSLRANP